MGRLRITHLLSRALNEVSLLVFDSFYVDFDGVFDICFRLKVLLITMFSVYGINTPFRR